MSRTRTPAEQAAYNRAWWLSELCSTGIALINLACYPVLFYCVYHYEYWGFVFYAGWIVAATPVRAALYGWRARLEDTPESEPPPGAPPGEAWPSDSEGDPARRPDSPLR